MPNTAKPWKLAHLTHLDVKAQMAAGGYQVALVLLGATEPHNHHLPYATDVLESEAVADLVCAAAWAKGARVLALPCIPFGVQSNLMSVPDAFPINVYPSTMFALLQDVVVSLQAKGIRKIVLFNSHGGNDFLKPFIREMTARNPAAGEPFLCSINWWQVGADVYKEVFTHKDDHAGELETSVMLHLHPELVRPDAATDGAAKPTRFEAINKGWVSISRPWHLLTESTGVGDARQGSADKGKHYLDIVVPRLATFLHELAAANVNDPSFPF